MEKLDFAQEIEYLKNTIDVMDKEIASLKKSVAEAKDFVDDLREYYVQGTQIFGDIDNAEQVGINERINNLVDISNDSIFKAEKLLRNRNRPYFGRVRFENQDIEDFRIGLMSVESNNKYYVYDWRAPICELFYEYGKGQAQFSTPDGSKVKGEITLKRQYDIKDGELLDFYDVDRDIFDEYLQKILNQISTDKLHNIVSTIQREQDEIIRDLKDDLVVVQGYAGSGKTTVALHRIAYALYRLKDLKSANVLIFTLNEAFMSHIEGVLPEMGEQNTRSATLATFAGRLLKIVKHFEENDEFINRYLDSNDTERNIICQKLNMNVKETVKNWVKKYENKVAQKGFKVREKAFPPKLLNELYQNEFTDLPYLNRINAIGEYVAKKLKVEKYDDMRVMIKRQVLKCFDASADLEEIYTQFCVENGWGQPDLTKIKTEDAILMCLLKQQLEDMVVKMDIKHIVIDEAQEYPLLFIDFLMHLFPRASFSIFGDKYQRTNPQGIADLQHIIDIKAQYRDAKLYSLDNTYRSSEEIVEYSSNIIGNPRHNAFRLKNGKDVETINIADTNKQIASQIMMILEKEIANKGTIGIITGDVKSAREIEGEIAKICPQKVCLIEDAKSNAFAQIQVIPATLCKGLEFNTAIVVNNGNLFSSELGNNLLFIACTRAINKLYVLENGK